MSAALLAVAAIGMQPAIDQAKQRYTKQPIAIKRPLKQIDFSAMPSFDVSFEPKTLVFSDQEIETQEKINVALTRRTPLPSGFHPESVLHAAYYSDQRHQVAHTPEVCLRQDGGIINALRSMEIEIPGLGPEHSTIPVRYVDVQRTSTARIIILYTFISNGRFYSDRDVLRLSLGLPGDKHVYSCKVEAAVPRTESLTDEEAIEMAKLTLQEAIPVLLRDHLPTRDEVAGP